MVNLSDLIEEFILKMFEDMNMQIEGADDVSVELKRNSLAQRFECSPSQINYVLNTRFNNQRGYYIESYRGGGGYVKLTRISSNIDDKKKIIYDNIGDSITCSSANKLIDYLNGQEFLSFEAAQFIKATISNRALVSIEPERRNTVRADIIKECILLITQ